MLCADAPAGLKRSIPTSQFSDPWLVLWAHRSCGHRLALQHPGRFYFWLSACSLTIYIGVTGSHIRRTENFYALLPSCSLENESDRQRPCSRVLEGPVWLLQMVLMEQKQVFLLLGQRIDCLFVVPWAYACPESQSRISLTKSAFILIF